MDPRFNPFLQSVVDVIHTWLPDLASCDTHPGRFDLAELKNFATKTPAVRIAVIGVASVELVATGERDATLTMAAYVVTKDAAGLPRHVSALNIVETLARLIPDHHMGQACAHGATDVRAQNLYSGDINKAGVNLWALSWSQTVRIGTSVFDDDGDETPLASELYVSCEPEVGPEHIDDYVQVEGMIDVD